MQQQVADDKERKPPTASLGSIINYRLQFLAKLKPHLGHLIAEDRYLTICRELAGDVLKKSKTGVVVQFDSELDERPDVSHVYRSVQALLAGHVLDKDLMFRAAFRLAGNIHAFKAGATIAPFKGLSASYMALARIRDVEYSKSRAKGIPGIIIEFGIMSGEAAGESVFQFFTERAYHRMARQIRVLSGRERRRVHPKELVGCALMLQLEQDEVDGLITTKYQEKVSLNEKNRQLTRLRRHERVCPKNYTHPCALCHVSYLQCKLGTHPHTYIDKVCPKCRQTGWVRADKKNAVCIVCDAKQHRNYYVS